MKKFIFLLTFALFCGYFAQGQTVVGPKTLATFTLVDSTHNYDLTVKNNNYAWMMQLSWTKNDDTLRIIPYCSLDSTNWVLYPGMDTVYSTDATGTIAWDDVVWTAKYLRFSLLTTDTTTGTLKYMFKLP